jgi:rubredoxin
MKTGLEFPPPIQHPIFHCDNCDFDFSLLNVWPGEDESGCELTVMGEHTDRSWYCPHCGCKQGKTQK